MTYKMLIGGNLVGGARTLDVYNPATGAVFATCPRADEAQLDQAVAAAHAAFPAWAARPLAERRALLDAIADALEARREEFGRLLTQEVGRPLPQAIGEVVNACHCLRVLAGIDLGVRTIRETSTDRIFEQRAPLGVVAAIMPWNFPIHQLLVKLGSALIVGNTMVAKPAPAAPLATLLFAELASKILPSGVLNVIIDNNDLGAALTSHPDVAKISFTGSTATGKLVMQSAAATLKRLTLELGGNDAAIVMPDADVEAVAPKIFGAAMANAGQVCVAVKRVYAHSSVYDQLCTEFVRLAGEQVVDDGFKQGATMGPLQNKAQYDRVKDLLADAKANGRVIVGGEVPDRDGYFIPPTVVCDLPEDSRLVREEQFGPLLPVLSFDDVDDVIGRVNDSAYGLGGSVWTRDVARGIEIASQIQSGTAWVNKVQDVPIEVPYRGAKQSGIGTEYGEDGVKEYTQAQIINVAL